METPITIGFPIENENFWMIFASHIFKKPFTSGAAGISLRSWLRQASALSSGAPGTACLGGVAAQKSRLLHRLRFAEHAVFLKYK
jgi:hypothetical protein